MRQFEMIDIAPENLDGFTVGYIMAMFWTEEAPGVTTEEWLATDDHAEGTIPSDVGFADLDPETLAAIVQECKAFQNTYEADLAICYDGYHGNGMAYDEASAGHDFWLTRNGHGVGFWDRFRDGTDQFNAADRLSEVCRHKYRNVDVYLGDDGKVYTA